MYTTTSILDRWRSAPKDIRRMVAIWIFTGISFFAAAVVLWKAVFYDIQFVSGLESMKAAITIAGAIFAILGLFVIMAAIAFLQKLAWGRASLEFLAWSVLVLLIGFHLLCISVLLGKWTAFKLAILPWEIPELLLVALILIMMLPVISGVKEIKRIRSQEIKQYSSN